MTTTYDPFDPAYLDEADCRAEMTRVFDLCHGCRLCFKFCPAFPTLFSFVDAHDDQDAGRLSEAEQDQVVDECFQCKLCYINCPYTPGQHEWELDFPRLMMRADQVRVAKGERSVRERVQDQALARTDLAGTVGTALAPLVNPVLGRPGSLARRAVEATVGIAAERLLPPYARQRFSTWWKRRPGPEPATVPRPQGRVALFPTCLVEYQDPQVGKDVVRVYERNGIEVSVPGGWRCCGAPWLHGGDVERFRGEARRNIAVLADQVRQGRHVVVPQPTCGLTLKQDYVDYVGGPDAELVASHTRDAAEHLMAVHKAEGTALDTGFAGPVPAEVTYHAPCHLRMQQIGLRSRDLMKLTGAKVTVVAECSGIDGTWGYRAQNYELSRGVGRKLAQGIERAGGEVVAGDCHLANGGILQETGRRPVHPLSLVARAYGIPEGG